MNKKLLAVAVAGALAAPAVAFAQASSVQIYGRANLGFDTYSATGATAGAAADYKSRNRIYDSGSRLGFRGTEDLGGGLSAVFVLESGVNFDSGSVNGQAGVPNASAGTLASRDSWVGLQGSWGRVSFGRQSIFWVNGPHGQTGANHVNTDIGWYNGAAFTGVARQSNVLAYNSPTMSGFNFTLSYQPNSENAGGGANTDARVWGLTVRKVSGPIDAQYDYVSNLAASGAANRLERKAHKLNVGWPYAPGSRVSMVFGWTTQDDVAARAATAASAGYALHDDIKQNYWGVNWEQSLGGPWMLYGMYSKVANQSGCSVAGGCSNTGASYTSANPVAAGADPKVFAIGVQHNF